MLLVCFGVYIFAALALITTLNALYYARKSIGAHFYAFGTGAGVCALLGAGLAFLAIASQDQNMLTSGMSLLLNGEPAVKQALYSVAHLLLATFGPGAATGFLVETLTNKHLPRMAVLGCGAHETIPAFMVRRPSTAAEIATMVALSIVGWYQAIFWLPQFFLREVVSRFNLL